MTLLNLSDIVGSFKGHLLYYGGFMFLGILGTNQGTTALGYK